MRTSGQSPILQMCKARVLILSFSVLVVFLGLANFLEGLVKHEGFWIPLGIGFLVPGVVNYIVRRRGR
jgi:hypothetical protein